MARSSDGQRIVRRIRAGISDSTSPWADNPFSRSCSKVSQPKAFDIPKLKTATPPKRRMRLALISLPELNKARREPYNKHTTPRRHQSNVDYDACRRDLVVQSPQTAKELCSQYKSALDTAVAKYRSQIVCVNELGFPCTKEGPLQEVIDATREVANEYKCVIIAGSCHDARTLYNTGHIYYPDCEVPGKYYHKQVSAIAHEIGERVSIPSERRTLVTRAFGLGIAVLICLDLADYSAVAGVVQSGETVDLLLVPAYSEMTDSLKRLVIDASAAMPGIVALVNFHGRDVKGNLMYRFGVFKEPTKTIPLGKNGGSIDFHDFNVEAFEKEKWNLQGHQDRRLQWLFGLSSVEPR